MLTFWSKRDADEEGDWPHPLQCVRDAVGPFIVTVKHRFDDANTNGLTKTPAEVYICS